jgi:cation diffusion facilitator CzcD-associated flavoprotein CzcO
MSESRNGQPDTTVAIIGAGFGAICMEIKLHRAGIPYTIFEKASSVGGVWRDTRFFDAGNYEAYPPVESRPMTATDAAK